MPNDRLAEIKARWEAVTAQDIGWLVGEIEGLRGVANNYRHQRDSVTKMWDTENNQKHECMKRLEAAEARAEKAEAVSKILASNLANQDCLQECGYSCEKCWLEWAASQTAKGK